MEPLGQEGGRLERAGARPLDEDPLQLALLIFLVRSRVVAVVVLVLVVEQTERRHWFRKRVSCFRGARDTTGESSPFWRGGRLGAVVVVGAAVVDGHAGAAGHGRVLPGWSCGRQAFVTCPRASRHTTIRVWMPSSPQLFEHWIEKNKQVNQSVFTTPVNFYSLNSHSSRK